MCAAACPQAMYGNRYGAPLIQSDVHTVYLWHLFNGFIVQLHFSYYTNFIEKLRDFTEAVTSGLYSLFNNNVQSYCHYKKKS